MQYMDILMFTAGWLSLIKIFLFLVSHELWSQLTKLSDQVIVSSLLSPLVWFNNFNKLSRGLHIWISEQY